MDGARIRNTVGTMERPMTNDMPNRVKMSSGPSSPSMPVSARKTMLTRPIFGSSSRSHPRAEIMGGMAMGTRMRPYMSCRPGVLVRSTSHASGNAKKKPTAMAPAPNSRVLDSSS